MTIDGDSSDFHACSVLLSRSSQYSSTSELRSGTFPCVTDLKSASPICSVIAFEVVLNSSSIAFCSSVLMFMDLTGLLVTMNMTIVIFGPPDAIESLSMWFSRANASMVRSMPLFLYSYLPEV